MVRINAYDIKTAKFLWGFIADGATFFWGEVLNTDQISQWSKKKSREENLPIAAFYSLECSKIS